MKNADYTSPYYPIPYPKHAEPVTHAPSPYASAPPYSSNPHVPHPPPPSSSADFTNYPSVPQITTDHVLSAAPSPYSQPQSSYSFPQFESHTTYPSQSPAQSQSSYYPRYDHQLNYASGAIPYPSPQTVSYSSAQPHCQLNSVGYDAYDPKFSRAKSDLGSESYGNRDRSGCNNYSSVNGCESVLGENDGVYAYRGNNEPYGARGTAPKSSTWSGFDDFGRPIGYSSSSSAKEPSSLGSGLKVVKAIPKEETKQDPKGGVQKYRVKLLAESAGQTTMDVLCQIGLDGIRMLDPSTNMTLRIYLLESITRCEAIDSSILAFWSKSPVDIDARRIRLRSNSYTTTTLLDTITAAIAQYKEISARSGPSDPKFEEQYTEKKKGFVDFMNLIKPVNVEKDHWVPDEAVAKCISCGTHFSAFVRRHHCRNCGDIFCDKCSQGRSALTAEDKAPMVRVCNQCLGEVARRLNNAKEASTKNIVVQSHGDLAKKLQEELERSCKISSGSRSISSGKRMEEVACPTCTVHLQVQVPSSGTETIECGVCQHQFHVTGC